nr:protein MLP1 homolog isoform X1 [Drosophila suzukii]
MFVLLGVLCLLQTASLVPAQLITLRDGKVGVNFAGFHADAGLGGLLTGNSAHGGLSASAGTPWGSRAAAGLGGNLDGRAAGVGYAAAQANPSVGASALLGGSAGEHGYIGAEAHSPGRSVISSSSSNHGVQPAHPENPVPASPTYGPVVTSHIQRVKPPKKYSLIKQDPDRSEIIENHVKAAADADGDAVDKHQPLAFPEFPAAPPTALVIVKRPRPHAKRQRQRQRVVYVMQQQQQQPQEQQIPEEAAQKDEPQSTVEVKSEAKAVHVHKYKSVQRPQAVNNRFLAPQAQGPVGLALDIPIGILRSLQQSLGALAGGVVPAVAGAAAGAGVGGGGNADANAGAGAGVAPNAH